MNRIICGVDVSKDWLDAHVWPGGAAARFANDAAGIALDLTTQVRYAVSLLEAAEAP